jgi:choline dehydrogenase-like flavoprotein
MAQKILFDSNKTATGVEVESLGITYTIYAAKEVIVSAGAFHSPQMLMVSGIGPAATLEEFGIPVLSDFPGVGQDMWDHITFGPSYRVNVNTFTRLANDFIYLAERLVEYETNQSGPLCNSADFLGWEKVLSDLRGNFTSTTESELSYFPSDWPEVEVCNHSFLQHPFNTSLRTDNLLLYSI